MAMPMPINENNSISLSAESIRQRIRMLESENRRLMIGQGQLVAETNRKVEMHLNEIRMLKDEIKGLRTSNRQLQDLCCFLEEDRQKTRQLSKEWQKFGRYTSELMKQEITTYQQRLSEQDQRQKQLLTENDELKRLCLYLDEQRQAIITQATAMAEEACGTHLYYGNSTNDGDSSDAGCGSSEKSDSEREFSLNHPKSNNLGQNSENQVEFDHEKEKELRILAKSMQINSTEEVSFEFSNLEEHKDRIFNYIQSLENRIKTLEHSGTPNRFSKSSFGSDDFCENKIEDESKIKLEKNQKLPLKILSNPEGNDQLLSQKSFCNMIDSTTSTMTSSGTTYCSSETDESTATAVFVMGDEEQSILHLEVRKLGPIDEEQENDTENGSEIQRSKKNPLLNLKNLSPMKFIEKRISSASETSNISSGGEQADTEENGAEVEELPPKMPLMADATARLSLCSSNLSLDNCSNSSSSKQSGNTNRSLPEDFNSLGRLKGPPSYAQLQLKHRASFNCPAFSPNSRLIQNHSSLAEAVRSFQSNKDAVIRKSSSNTWERLRNPSTTEAQITAV